MHNIVNRLLTTVLGRKDNSVFESRLVLTCILYATLICFISTFFNIFFQLGIGSVLIVAISFVAYGFMFIIGRFYQKLAFSKLLFSIYTILFCDFYWLLNFGSKGSAIFIFPVYYSIMVFIWESKQVRIITIFVLLNLFTLFLVEYLDPDRIPSYPSNDARLIDTYLGLILFLGVLSTLVLTAKKNYITQFKNAQRSDRLKTSFLANMSHEIRTPLNAIIGFSKLLSEKELPKEKKIKYSGIIEASSQSLIKLIADILDASLIESGQLRLKITKVNLNVLLEKLNNNLQHIQQNKINPTVKLILCLPSESLMIETDEFRLEQIFIHLISNALKFTKEGYIKIGYIKDNGHAMFYVEDTGIGIKEELQPEIFNRFVKNEEFNTLGKTRGTGLGLSLSRDLIKMLGGKIWFISEYMKGTTFFFSIPIQPKKGFIPLKAEHSEDFSLN